MSPSSLVNTVLTTGRSGRAEERMLASGSNFPVRYHGSFFSSVKRGVGLEQI